MSDDIAQPIDTNGFSRGAAEKPRRLGKGLGALLGETRREEPLVRRDEPSEPPADGSSPLRMLSIASIKPLPGNPRKYFDEALPRCLALHSARVRPSATSAHGGSWRASTRARGAGRRRCPGRRRRRARRRREHVDAVAEIDGLLDRVRDEEQCHFGLLDDPVQLELQALAGELHHQARANAVGNAVTQIFGNGAMVEGWRSAGVDLSRAVVIRPSGTPVEGIRTVLATRPDVVLLDRNLPDADVARVYTPTVMVLAILVFVLPPLLFRKRSKEPGIGLSSPSRWTLSPWAAARFRSRSRRRSHRC